MGLIVINYGFLQHVFLVGKCEGTTNFEGQLELKLFLNESTPFQMHV